MSFRQEYNKGTRFVTEGDIDWLEQFQYKTETRIRSSLNNDDSVFRFLITLGKHPDPANFIRRNELVFATLGKMIDEKYWYEQKYAERKKIQDFILPANDITNTEKDALPTAEFILRMRDKILLEEKKSSPGSLEARLLEDVNKMSGNEFTAFILSPQSHPKYHEFRAVAEAACRQDQPTPQQYICYALVCEDIRKIDHDLLVDSIKMMMPGGVRDHVVEALNRTAGVAYGSSHEFSSMINVEHDARVARGMNDSTTVMPANFSGATLDHINVGRLDWRANMRGFNLSGATFTNCDLSFADLRGVNLTGAVLQNVNISSVILIGAILKDVKISEGVLIKDPVLFARNEDAMSVEQAREQIDGFRQLKIPDKEIERQFNDYVSAVAVKDPEKASVLSKLAEIELGKVVKKNPAKSTSDQSDYRGENKTVLKSKEKVKSGLLSGLSFLSRRKNQKPLSSPAGTFKDGVKKKNKF